MMKLPSRMRVISSLALSFLLDDFIPRCHLLSSVDASLGNVPLSTPTSVITIFALASTALTGMRRLGTVSLMRRPVRSILSIRISAKNLILRIITAPVVSFGQSYDIVHQRKGFDLTPKFLWQQSSGISKALMLEKF